MKVSGAGPHSEFGVPDSGSGIQLLRFGPCAKKCPSDLGVRKLLPFAPECVVSPGKGSKASQLPICAIVYAKSACDSLIAIFPR